MRTKGKSKPAPTLFGYQRVSHQNLDSQRDALIMAGVDPERISEDKLPGARYGDVDRKGI